MIEVNRQENPRAMHFLMPGGKNVRSIQNFVLDELFDYVELSVFSNIIIIFSLQPRKNLFNGHINDTSVTISSPSRRIKLPPLPNGYCYCANEHVENDKCGDDDAYYVPTINFQGAGNETCVSPDGRGISVLSDLLSFGLNKDYDPNVELVSKHGKEENDDITLRLIEASLNNKSASSTGSPGRIGRLTNTHDNDINVGGSGSFIRVPSKGNIAILDFVLY